MNVHRQLEAKLYYENKQKECNSAV